MSALEQEILEKFRLLDKAARRRVLAQIEQEADNQFTDFTTGEPMAAEEWLEWASGFRAKLHEKYGSREVPSSADLVNEVREE